MNLKILFSYILIALSFGFVKSQNITTPNCGLSLEDGELIFQRMLENRRQFNPNFQRTTKYIPVKFTIVGDNNGNGYVDIDRVFDMLCDMNNDYRSQGVQFYMKDINNSVRYSNNNSVYNDGASNASQSWMFSNKSSNCINIYMSASVNNGVASYYTSWADFIFVLNSMTNGTSSTGSHEVGHFFGLPHTFFGWEGTTFSGGTAPSSVNGRAVERVARTGSGSNCAIAGDGFCDTPADYFSDRVPCPYTGNGLDPTGTPINPEESLIMSYFFDACVDSFSTEQKAAVSADIQSRGWNNFPLPTPNSVVSGSSINGVSPLTNTTIPLNGDITLTWDVVPNSTGYVVLVERTLFGTPISTVLKRIVYGTNTVTIPAASLSYPRQYSWKVKPFNQYQTCGNYSNTFTFNTLAPATNISQNQNLDAELKILNNPIINTSAQLLINVPAEDLYTLSLYGMDGKKVVSLNSLELSAGDNLQILDVSEIANGTYFLVLNSDKINLYQKMLIQK